MNTKLYNQSDAERADWLLREANLPLNYRQAMEQLVQCIEVDPSTIKEKLSAAMRDARSAMIVVFGHGRKWIQEQYRWADLFKPYETRLDGAIFMCCQGDKTIKKQLKELSLKSQKSFIINRWRNNVLKAPKETRAAFYTYTPPTSPMQHGDLMSVLLEFANAVTKPFRDPTLCDHVEPIEDPSSLHWSNDI